MDKLTELKTALANARSDSGHHDWQTMQAERAEYLLWELADDLIAIAETAERETAARDAERANRGIEVARLKTQILEERAHWEAVRDEALAVSKRNYLEAERLRDEIQQLTHGARP